MSDILQTYNQVTTTTTQIKEVSVMLLIKWIICSSSLLKYAGAMFSLCALKRNKILNGNYKSHTYPWKRLYISLRLYVFARKTETKTKKNKQFKELFVFVINSRKRRRKWRVEIENHSYDSKYT